MSRPTRWLLVVGPALALGATIVWWSTRRPEPGPSRQKQIDDAAEQAAKSDPRAAEVLRLTREKGVGRSAKLVEFYATEGVADEVRVGLPKGRYRPSIEVRRRGASSHDFPVPEQEIRFCQADDGTSIAYAVSGRGYPFVEAANWLSHLEFDHLSPVWRHWWRELASRFRRLAACDDP